MKFLTSWLIAILLLTALDVNAQSFTREQLLNLEKEAVSVTTDSVAPQIIPSNSQYDLMVRKTFAAADSTAYQVLRMRQNETATFELTVVPFLEVQCRKLDLKPLDFSDNEEQLFDSFLKVVDWNKAIGMVKLYEEFIRENTKDEETCHFLLAWFAYVRQLKIYLIHKNNEAINFNCLDDNFGSANIVDVIIFAINPGRLLLWTVAACAWAGD